MIRVVIGSNNAGKLRELLPILGDLPVEFVTPAQLGIRLEVEETGATYAENARLKALAFSRATGQIALADDSGLEVETLGGVPGLHSARYAGPGASDADRRRKLLAALRAVPPPRPACFRCVIAIAQPDGRVDDFEGMCAGQIALEERGANGFGYDPLFYLPEYGRTMAELPEAVKNRISHRARAALAARPFLLTLAGV
jgi:XTP/dITP diphosphohydrolase